MKIARSEEPVVLKSTTAGHFLAFRYLEESRPRDRDENWLEYAVDAEVAHVKVFDVKFIPEERNMAALVDGLDALVQWKSRSLVFGPYPDFTLKLDASSSTGDFEASVQFKDLLPKTDVKFTFPTNLDFIQLFLNALRGR